MRAGLRAVRKWNVPARLAEATGKAINTPDGWELTRDGKAHVAQQFPTASKSPTDTSASRLALHLPKVADLQVKAFIHEAVQCLEYGLLRASVVLSWVGAIAVLQQYVVANHLAAFNAQAKQRNTKWKDAQTPDDISSRMEEYDFLQVCAAISIFGKSVKLRLEQALKLRNGAGHPNQLAVAEYDATAHVEALLKNVFEKYV